MGDNALTALKPLLQPENVAIIGASRTPGKQGHTVLTYLRRGGFAGGIFPVNPSVDEIDGLRCFRSIGDVPARVDCALLVVPASAAVDIVRDCAQHGVRSIIVGSTGYAELDTDEGRARQAAIVNAARQAQMLVLGPNTNGIYNATDGFSFGYNVSHGEPPTPGPVSIAAHSGALFNSVLPRLRELGVGLSKYVPVGNEADLSMLDFLEYFIADPATRVIGLIVEAVTDGARFRALAAQAQAANKPIVALKLGRSPAGAGATVAHSSRLAGSARAYDAVFREYGIASVRSVEALAGACAVLLATRTRPPDTSLVCVSSTGGGASMLADFAAARDIKLAGNSDGTWGGKVAETVAAFKNIGIIRNPTDTGQFPGHQHLLNDIFLAQEADGYSGPVMVYAHCLPTLENSQLIAEMLGARQRRTGSPVVVAAPGGLPAAVVETYREHGVALFHDLATAFDALQAYFDTAQAAALPPPTRDDRHAPVGVQPLRGADFLSEIESAEILRSAGVPMVESWRVTSEDDACDLAAKRGFPIVIKAIAPGVAHKNKIGFVATNITDEPGLRRAYAQIKRRIQQSDVAPSDVTVIVQPMLAAKLELIVGVTWEEPFGHFLLAGLGGIYAELLDEIILLPLPMARETILRRLANSIIGKLVRHSECSAALAQIEDTLCALQNFALAHGNKIRSIDVNPLLVTQHGCTAVDALIVPA